MNISAEDFRSTTRILAVGYLRLSYVHIDTTEAGGTELDRSAPLSPELADRHVGRTGIGENVDAEVPVGFDR